MFATRIWLRFEGDCAAYHCDLYSRAVAGKARYPTAPAEYQIVEVAKSPSYENTLDLTLINHGGRVPVEEFSRFIRRNFSARIKMGLIGYTEVRFPRSL